MAKAAKKPKPKKILILSASPVRDKYIDEVIAEELRKYGHRVMVKPCLREGRASVLKYKPDIVVVPPIRNPYSVDFVGTLKSWGCGVISRHTEPSCDWADYKSMDENQKSEILGRIQYFVDVELVWSSDEAQILNRRPSRFKAVPIGAVGLDIYFRQDLRERLTNRQAFLDKYKFANKKKTLLIASAWGFADSAPDLHIDDTDDAQGDIKGRDGHIAMIKALSIAISGKWNILVTTHPGVLTEPYTKALEPLQIPLDSDSPMMEMLINCDALIHAGSTAAVSAHLLDIPAYQFGDVNAKSNSNWWGRPKSAISRVSPFFKTPKSLVIALEKHRRKSNADKSVIKELEQGRYGIMDGQSVIRAAQIITKVPGKFQMCWPQSTNNYNQKGIAYRKMDEVFISQFCGVCRQQFLLVKEYMEKQIANKKLPLHCPWCGARTFMRTGPQ